MNTERKILFSVRLSFHIDSLLLCIFTIVLLIAYFLLEDITEDNRDEKMTEFLHSSAEK